MPVLQSQHADYTDVRHHRLPLQESTGNVQAHANSNVSSGYCSPVSGVPAITSSGPASSLSISCTPVSASAAASIPTPPIVPTQSLERQQQQAYYQSQQEQHNLYNASSLKQYPHSHVHNQHHNQQQLITRRQTHASVRHHAASNNLAMAGPLAAPSLRSNSYSHPGMGGYTGAVGSNALTLHSQHSQNHNVNPIYASPQFQAYRKKQGEKDDKTEQIWPDVLEDAFLDALLLIPQMGRKKYAMRGQLHGRNMLISEYLWVAYCLSLPPGAKPDRKMARGRKQVSSHIQVLKNFFIHHRCYHFFFPSKEKKEDLSSSRKDAVEKESFKDNPVLRALFEGRLPAERPNYEYFGQLLASDAMVAVRPSLCWILVSSSAVRFESEGHRRGEAFKSDGMPLDGRSYPHLALNLKREEWPERGKIIRGTLLQEYTRALSQKEASSVREISVDWEDRFPGPMMDALDGIVRDDLRDILHFHVTLDVQEPDRFPEGSELNSLVEVTIEQPGLQNHRWKSVTRLARPWELMPSGTTPDEGADSDDQVPVSVITREIGNQYMHRPGCHAASSAGNSTAHCDCFNNQRLRRQQLAVPFPAPEWATMLSMLTGYRKHSLEPEIGADGTEIYTTTQRGASKKRSSFGSTTTATTSASRRRSSGESTEDGDDSFVSSSSAGSNNGTPTQMDLVKNIAMLQELWSCGPSSSSGEEGTWTRRAVILWTFETVYSVNEKKMEVVKIPAGTGWRFLTTIDPTSQYHQQQALMTPGKSTQTSQAQPMPSQQMYPHRDNIMSPHPGYQQHLNASISEHLGSSTWDPAMSAMSAAYNPVPAYNSYGYNNSYNSNVNASANNLYRNTSLSPHTAPSYNVPPPLNLLDASYNGTSGGLTTPPPSASLTSPYETQQPAQSSTTAYNQNFQNQLSFMSASSTVSGGSPPGDENAVHGHQNNSHRGSVIDPFLAGNAAQNSQLPDWDASDVASALNSWPSVSGAEVASTTATARGQKRSRSDSLDAGNGGYPVSSMPKLSHNGFSNWR